MAETYTVERMLALRKLTRSVAELLRAEMKEHLLTLSPLLRPRVVFGEYVEHNSKDTVHGADRAFKELQERYESLAGAAPFNLPRELKAPFEVISSALEITPYEYVHEAKIDSGTKPVSVTSPLTWVLSYSGFPPDRFRALLSRRDRDDEELRQFLLHYVVLETVVRRQAGVARILEALHFPLASRPAAELGGAPLTLIAAGVSTKLPDDAVIVESTEVSGTDAFEEVVAVEDVAALGNPLRDRLVAILDRHGERAPA